MSLFVDISNLMKGPNKTKATIKCVYPDQYGPKNMYYVSPKGDILAIVDYNEETDRIAVLLHLQTTSGMPLYTVKAITWTYFFLFHDKSCIERTV